MPPPGEVFDPVPLIEALARAEVDFVLIGGVAGGSYGSAYGTFDVGNGYPADACSTNRHNAFTIRICSIVRQRISSSFGLATSRASA